MSSEKRILDAINSPADLKALNVEELEILASEIRDQIIETTSKNGGHVASSLGAVEIILTLHSLLDSPNDKIIFDVGHQSYAHKLVTGRRDMFHTLRTYEGLSGFPRPSENLHDVHPSGHASDSLSIAAGIAEAMRESGSENKVAVVIGDAAIAGGMSFEALNFIGSKQLPILIVLNDNKMSISTNVGALMKHFGNMRATTQYKDARESFQQRLERGGKFSNAFVEFGKRTKDSMKHMFIPDEMIYENLGIVCTPPIDGHNIKTLMEMFTLALSSEGPVLVHAVTKKGAGYDWAESDPERFHGIGPYDIESGESISSGLARPTYTQVFGRSLVEEAKKNDSIYALTAAMEGGTGLKDFHREFPNRFFDVGIAEENAVGMAAGMAIEGKKPFVCIYSTFIQRALDQIIVDVALPKFDVVFVLDRAGLVGDDGPTHHGAFDISFLRMIPNMIVSVPSNLNTLSDAVHTAANISGPFAIRYPRGSAEEDSYDEARESELLEPGKSKVVREGDDITILAFGRMVRRALDAAEILSQEGISARVVDMLWAKPLDEEAIIEASKTKLIVTVEEGVIAGGAGEGVLDILSRRGIDVPTCVLGIDDKFVLQGKSDFLLADLGLDGEGISTSIRSKLSL